ncbi:hypothetical protein TVAG_166120 [Trichomonas vaginalis G3]|uniref:DUF3447 domain-containing protein n=1 Tax=Trichomonas vaginalis (strain ATCC PRA-98 / G3) TaxID=412133 RepID=A2DE19_TRIV3|nr:spectrin binding [Trichomonas vaginalis G3]EAY21237.1 hypothetical protein TVAG_166120 [Trichomonas vaginalis G3]KAI5548800.1 spectrin binding [Trichomonas vaginalis G3]|eukprot:XP_001582223.1 hypothetical protein [Trichomonas vaginalis G3]
MDKIDRYNELRSKYKYHIDSYNTLYQLNTEDDEGLSTIYKIIQTNLIDSMKYHPENIIKDILDIIPYNNCYEMSYLKLAKLITDEYQVKEVKNLPDISNHLFYKEYGINLSGSNDFDEFNSENIDIYSENTIYNAIMKNDLKRFIIFTERDEFDEDQRLQSKLFPQSSNGYSLLELCCYYGAADCFKLLRTKFNSEITETCLEFSFLGKNPEIMSECLKYQKPNQECMKYTIISHKIDFVTFLMNEYDIRIDLRQCGGYNNLESLLVYFDKTALHYLIGYCFIYSACFNIPSLCEYFISLGTNIIVKDGREALYNAVKYNNKEVVECLLSHGANFYKRQKHQTPILYYAIITNKNKEMAELLISHGANIDERDNDGETIFDIAFKEFEKNRYIVELLISLGAHFNPNFYLINAASSNNLEKIKFLASYNIDLNAKNLRGETSLHIAFQNYFKEITEFFISHGANINEKNQYGETVLHIASDKNNKEMLEYLITHGSDVNAKDRDFKTALHHSTYFKNNILLNFLFCMVQILMQKIKMGKQLFIMQCIILIKKWPSFFFHMVQALTKKMGKEKLLFILQHLKMIKI